MKKHEIFTTKNYNLFKKLPGNRPINAKNLREIIESMKEDYNPVNVIVNEKMEVIDGQHRIEACKILGFPVEYQCRPGWGLAHAQRLNKVSKHWDAKDFANSFVEQGNKHYAEYVDFQSKYKFSASVSIALLLGVNNTGGTTIKKLFNVGKFKVKSYNDAATMAEQLIEIGKHFNKAKKPRFISAMITVMKHKEYSQKKFIHKLKTFPTLMVDCPSSLEFLKRIEYVYNYQSKGGNIRFY